ncbi:MAG: cytochrome c oxidase subunit II [Bauldia litoralis]|uniref:cytochrome c oxidase subunit II n=2 Tax=Bauldia litoralis TaxID=665467 RepID=UPI003298788B
MTRAGAGRAAILVAGLALLGACSGSQSALDPTGVEAGRVATLSWVLFIGAAVIFVGVLVLTVAAVVGPAGFRTRLGREGVVIAGGIVFPVVILTILLGYGLTVMRAGGAEGDGEGASIAVVGEQWWWRVIYTDAEGRTFESANEIRIPTGRPVKLALTTADVIHSLWVPKLAGKLDMIPGRTNTLTLEAEEPGVSRGQCAEYCGGAHAFMAFHVVAMEPEDYDAWLDREAAVASRPGSTLEERGQLVFLSSGCGACHQVRGTDANGVIGPDLTHVGGRIALAAGTLPNSREAIADWIVANQHIKPQNKMPPYAIFSDAELDALSSYLASLE